MRYVIDLRSRKALQIAIAGGKGAGLAWVHRQGYSVPPGFIITTKAHIDFMAALEGEPAASRIAPRRAFADSPLPRALQSEIARAYHRLGGSVAVRSSVVSEDGSAASFAGQFDTCLNIEGLDSVVAAVRGCWASAVGSRVAQYAAPESTAENALAMAVVVQRMVDAQAGGVAFSVDPLTGEDRVVIEAVVGLGQGVVSGTAAPDRYVVDERGALAEYRPVIPGAGLLTEEQVLQLARTVRELDRRAGGPRDIEWAWDGEGLHVLQCRPITGLRARRIYSRRLVADMAPGLVKPLVFSTNSLAVAREVFGRIFGELAGAGAIECERLVVHIHSRVYADMTLIGDLLERSGLPANLMEMMLRDEQAGRRQRMPFSLRSTLAMARVVRLMVRYGRLPRNRAGLLAGREAALTACSGRDWTGAPSGELLARLDQLVAERNGYYFEFFTAVMRMAAHTQLLRRWLERRAPEVQVSDLTAGLVGLRGLEPSRQIRQLGQQARALDTETRQRLLCAPLPEIEATLGQTPAGRELLADFDGLLERFGFLSSNGSDFTAKAWNEDPLSIWRAVGRAASHAANETRDPVQVRKEAERLVGERAYGLGGLAFRRLSIAAANSIRDREAISLLMSRYSSDIRRLFLALGETLTASGAISAAEDIFYLTYPELHALLDGSLDTTTAREHIAARQAIMAADETREAPDIIREQAGQRERTEVADPTSALEGREYLSGIRGSSGLAQGRARIVRDPMDAPTVLSRDDILVVPFSDVGWTPLFSGIGGVVVETGGQLSHAAIVAREYGLPAVLSVAAATRLIHEGQILTLDGSRGRVYLGVLPTAD